MLRQSQRSQDRAIDTHRSIRVPTTTATPRRIFGHLFVLGAISILCYFTLIQDKSFKGLITSVDNVSKRQILLGIQSNQQESLDIRSNRFPSVEERVKLYMSNWYVPPCPGNVIRVKEFTANCASIQEITTTTQAAKKEMGRILLFKSEVHMDNIFFLDRQKLRDCIENPPVPPALNYCQDVQATLLPALDRVGDNGTTPFLLQFGDMKASLSEGYVNLPVIKKIRSVATQASLSNVTLNRCYSGPRDPLHTKHDKEHFQPILWKLNRNRHYDMIPKVQENDIAWSLKKNMAVFRGSLTGVSRIEASLNSNFDVCMNSLRCRLVFHHANSTLVDARITNTIDLINNTINGVKVTGKLLDMKEQLQYKALIMVEGNDVATGLKWALLSNSVVMMQPPSHTSWAMEELLDPWVHYVPLNEKLSDVEEKTQWVLDNDKEAQLIAQRGTLWIHDLVLHPDASNDDKMIQDEIIRRYRAHFIVDEDSANDGSTQSVFPRGFKSLKENARSSPLAASKDLMLLAFYYPWYTRDDWSQYGTQGSTPLLGHYGSNEREVAERHIEMAIRGGIDAWVVSWWSKDSPVTANFVKGMLSAQNIDKIKFCMIYESIGALPVEADYAANGTLTLDKFISDMIFFRDSYFGHPSYLHINGRPVVHVYVTRFWKNFEPFMLEQIKTAVGTDILIIADDTYYGHNKDPATAQNGVKNGKPVFEAYTSYNMYESEFVQEGERAVDYMLREALPIYEHWSNETVFFPHVLPKYHDFREGHKVMVGDAAGLLTQLETFACLPRPSWFNNEFPDLMFVTSFNEWWEGTSIEPDAEDKYGYALLDTIRAFKDSGVQCRQKERIA